MKLSLLSIAALSVLSGSAFAVEPPVTIEGGKVQFTGDLVNAACAVTTGSQNKPVVLGQYRTASLAKDGDSTSPVPFELNLTDCDPTVQATASVAFQGTPATAGSTLLQVNGDGNTPAAKNVGIQITDHTAKALGVSGTVFSTPQTLIKGNNTLKFNAFYKATGESTPGQANANATFFVKYE
ncbi:type 1 fimbrial major subunit FimA [Acinetobacter bereziniae]|uniref:type 1 fimbrial major subunit FimA n=1 Tax=Acinetobacter bereziniae TaxID=106648 RepID=UPI001ABC7517|nr:type 1 fimbrial major subunit FimA [Acinetobacter bereziniae]MBO3653062.1 type 1 fimbrial major subunit FimA [Acinetobacter bereziniae]